MLGLEAPPQLDASRLAWDATTVLDAWLKQIRKVDFATLVSPTPSRDRTLRNLTVNVFHPFELLPLAFGEGRFDWDPTLDDAREASLQDAGAVVKYATDRYVAWQDWLRVREAELLVRDPVVHSSRGDITYRNLLASQRWHAAFHYRQLLAFLGGRGHDVSGALAVESLRGLDLPDDVF